MKQNYLLIRSNKSKKILSYVDYAELIPYGINSHSVLTTVFTVMIKNIDARYAGSNYPEITEDLKKENMLKRAKNLTSESKRVLIKRMLIE